MTVLARLPWSHADDQLAIACDVCVPPVLTVGTVAGLSSGGWLLESAGRSLDVCPLCRRTRPSSAWVRRADAEPASPDPAKLPNLIVVGAGKAGTTSLHAYLDLHPEIAMVAEKEMRFFTDPNHLAWLGRYQETFSAGVRYRGETSPAYAMSPVFPGVVDRMADLIPDVRLVYVVRDPVDRVVSEYVENVAWGAITVDIEEALTDAENPHHPLMAASRYASQLRELYRRFDPEQVHVIDMDAMSERPVEVLGDIAEWLGLDRVDLDLDALRPQNEGLSKGTLPRWYQSLRQPWLIQAIHRLPAHRLEAIRVLVRRRVVQPVDRPELATATRDRLRAILAPEVDELRIMTGLRFEGWSTSAAPVGRSGSPLEEVEAVV